MTPAPSFLKMISVVTVISAVVHGQAFSPIHSVFAADAKASLEPELILNDHRTAAELPTKRKIPTNQVVNVRPEESDRMIQTRLRKIAQSQEVFKKIQITVTEGIVTLKGDVEEEAFEKSFTALSEKVDGVIGVVDQLKVTNAKKTGLRLAESEVSDLTQKFFKFIPYLASCFVIFALTFLLGYGVYRAWFFFLSRRLARRAMLARHLSKILSIPIYLVGFYLILEVGGLAGLAATLVGGTGMLGIILGLASKNILENYLSSFMLTLRNPFNVGDQVIIGTETGVVHAVDSRCTMLLTSEGYYTQIPNSTVLAAVIKNITAHPLNRVQFTLRINKDTDITCFNQIFEEAVKMNSPAIAEDPKPEAVIIEMKARHAIMQCTFWVNSNEYNSGLIKSNVLKSLMYDLDQKRSEPPAPKTPQKDKAALQDSITKDKQAPSERKILESRTHDIKHPEPPANA